MNAKQVFVYTEEILIHAQLAASNYQTFLNLVNDPNSRQSREVWMFLQGFLSHYGMVSKLLFAPTGNGRAKSRAKKLQAHLSVEEGSALNDRSARNAIEHLDERLDYWLDVEEKGIIEGVFENREEFDHLSKDEWVVRRAYLIEESVFITEGAEGPVEMPLQHLVDELGPLCTTCQEKTGLKAPLFVVPPRQS